MHHMCFHCKVDRGSLTTSSPWHRSYCLVRSPCCASCMVSPRRGSSKLLMMGSINGAGKGRAEIILLTSRTSPRRKEQRESLLWKHYLSEPSRLAFLCTSWSGRMEHPQTY